MEMAVGGVRHGREHGGLPVCGPQTHGPFGSVWTNVGELERTTTHLKRHATYKVESALADTPLRAGNIDPHVSICQLVKDLSSLQGDLHDIGSQRSNPNVNGVLDRSSIAEPCGVATWSHSQLAPPSERGASILSAAALIPERLLNQIAKRNFKSRKDSSSIGEQWATSLVSASAIGVPPAGSAPKVRDVPLPRDQPTLQRSASCRSAFQSPQFAEDDAVRESVWLERRLAACSSSLVHKMHRGGCGVDEHTSKPTKHPLAGTEEFIMHTWGDCVVTIGHRKDHLPTPRLPPPPGVPRKELDPDLTYRFRKKLLAATYTGKANMGLDELFSHMDADGSGELDIDEFTSAIREVFRVRKETVTDAELVDIFQALDEDSSGHVTCEELHSFLVNKGTPNSQVGEDQSNAGLKPESGSDAGHQASPRLHMMQDKYETERIKNRMVWLHHGRVVRRCLAQPQLPRPPASSGTSRRSGCSPQRY